MSPSPTLGSSVCSERVQVCRLFVVSTLSLYPRTTVRVSSKVVWCLKKWGQSFKEGRVEYGLVVHGTIRGVLIIGLSNTIIVSVN